MSLIKDFDELHIGLKTAFLTILCQMPFFFIAIYLFKHNMFDRVSNYPLADMDFWFILSICFCFSLTWFFMNVAVTFLTIKIAERIIKSEESEPHEIFIGTMIYSLFYLSVIIVINYNWEFRFNTFLLGAYTFLVFRMLWITIWAFIFRKYI